jgi:hypothetical protein
MSSIIIIDFFRFECLNSKQSMFRVKNVFNNGLILQALIIIVVFNILALFASFSKERSLQIFNFTKYILF